MRVSLNFYLDSKKNTNKDGVIIYLVLYSQGERERFHSGLRVPPEFWDSKKQEIKRHFPMYKPYNARLGALKKALDIAISEILINTPIISFAELRYKLNKHLRGSDGMLVVDAIGQMLNAKVTTLAVSTKNKYHTLRAHLDAYQQAIGDTIPLSQVDKSFLDEFLNYLYSINLSTNSAIKNLQFLRSVLRWCAEREMITDDKFRHYRMPKKAETETVALLSAEFEALINAEGLTPKLERIRDLFAFQTYIGQRVSDLMAFSKSDIITENGVVFWNMRQEKTNKQLKIPLIPQAVAILEKYNYELPTLSDQKYNNYLKELAKELGFDRTIKRTRMVGSKKEAQEFLLYEVISSHTARRTFVTMATHNKLPNLLIAAITGHGSIEMIQRYTGNDLALLSQRVGEIFEKK